jgi:hypothetical protein
MIKQTVNFNMFLDSFGDSYKNNFTYEGKRALFDYLEQLSEETGEDIELDTIALCCEYSEYNSASDCIHDCGYNIGQNFRGKISESKSLEYLKNNTQVIKFDKGIIIANF